MILKFNIKNVAAIKFLFFFDVSTDNILASIPISSGGKKPKVLY